jgi:hypothetical protein
MVRKRANLEPAFERLIILCVPQTGEKMFIVKSLKKGLCIACGKETEILEVEAQHEGLAGSLCIPDFRRVLKIAGANRPVENVGKQPKS